MAEITLAPVDASLCRACTTEKWFMHTDQNRVLGFGEGAEGVVKFMVEYFEAALERDKGDKDFELVGVYEDDKPVGFFGLEYLGPNRRAIQFFQFMKPGANGLSEKALQLQLCKTLYRKDLDVSRMEADVLSINREQIDVFKRVGMAQEGRKKRGFWMGADGFDVLSFGMTRSRHKMLKSGKRRKRK